MAFYNDGSSSVNELITADKDTKNYLFAKDQKLEIQRVQPRYDGVNIYDSTDILVGNKNYFINQYILPNKEVQCEDLRSLGENEKADISDSVGASSPQNQGSSTNDVVITPKTGKICTISNDVHQQPVIRIVTEDGSQKRRLRWLAYAGITCALLTVTAIVYILMNFLPKKISQPYADLPLNYTDGRLILVQRDAWGAKPADYSEGDLILPVEYVIIQHTTSDHCYTDRGCAKEVKNIQQYHLDLDFGDIGYSFLVGGNGLVYVGRSWDKVGAHTLGYNKKSIGIAFIGNFKTIHPTQEQLKATQLLLQAGAELNKLSADYKIYAARQVGNTESPGDQVYNEIKKWSHWSPVIPP